MIEVEIRSGHWKSEHNEVGKGAESLFSGGALINY
jgi:hypothetical protein